MSRETRLEVKHLLESNDFARFPARVLFFEKYDSVSRLAQDELRLLGHEVCSISNPSEDYAATAFKPDLLILDPQLVSDSDCRIFALLADDGNNCPVVLGRHSSHLMASVRNAAERSGLAILGSLAFPYTTEMVSALLARVPVTPRDGTACDRLFVSRLIQNGRLLPSLTYEFLPELRLRDNSVVGFETLSRLRNRISLNPELIFSTSMITSLEVTASLLAFETSAHLWSALDCKSRRTRIASNCSASVLTSRDFAAGVAKLMRVNAIPQNAMVIELTEDPRPVDIGDLAEAMTGLAAKGVKFSLDDFGKGCANFDRIDRLPVSEVKIDRGLFKSCIEGDMPTGLLREIISLCRKKNIVSVIEGIETAEDLAFAKEMRADHGQGFYWGRPIKASGLGVSIPSH